VERPVEGDRLAGLGVVVEGLAERDAEEKDEEDGDRPHGPADDLSTPLLSPALVTLDRCQRHGV
jgi:hypothetical protein